MSEEEVDNIVTTRRHGETDLSISHNDFRSDVKVIMADETRGGDEAPNGVTTISTIAVQSGNTRLIIALLQSGRKQLPSVQLRVMEMEPAFALLGNNFQEADQLRKSHLEVIQKIQNKQSPVEELLAQADQMVASQEPRARVYSAMADSLGSAWRDLNRILEERRILLELNYIFQEHYQVRDDYWIFLPSNLFSLRTSRIKQMNYLQCASSLRENQHL